MIFFFKTLMVFLGGAAGAGLRFTIGELLTKTTLPGWIAIFCANVLGSFLIGYITAVNLMPLIQTQDASFISLINPLIAIGFCGGLTTYSTFSMDTVFLWFEQKYYQALFNIVGSIGLCFLSVWIGMEVAAA